MEWVVLGLFCAGLILCISLGCSILYALAAGLALFLLYGRRKGFSWKELLKMAAEGVRTVHNILIVFFLIGIMTALWRAAGTIPVIVLWASRLIRPSIFLLMTFLLNCAVSVMTGTSFGTAATMGVICSAMGAAAGADPVLTGGAILSGVFFGDRCSPVSTSALLVSTLTETDIYENIRHMIRSAFVPFALTGLLYLIIGFLHPGGGEIMDLEPVFSGTFRLNGISLIPAAVILILSCFRVNVKAAMTVSILAAVPVCLSVQNIPASELLRIALSGFHPEDPAAAAMVGGGGLLSMIRVAGIVCLSSSYSVIFQKTGLLEKLRAGISGVSHRTTPYVSVFLTSAVSSLIACNQTLAVILSHQLCREEYKDKEQLALDLEDSAVVMAPLVPWSIAGGVPLAAVGAPTAAITASFYLILLPAYRLLCSFLEKRKR